MSIEFILLGVIVLVVLVDFIMNSRKKSSVDNVVDQIESGKELKSKSKFPFSLDYFIKRKRNVVSFLIFVHTIKLCLHYFMYRSFIYVSNGDFFFTIKEMIKEDADLKWHIENIYYVEEATRDMNGDLIGLNGGSKVWLFIPSFIIVGVCVWLINDKIKAR